MGTAQATEYCSFTRAIEQLGDRWTLLIVRELGLRGPRRFNELAADLPGRISRSVLTDRLHRLAVLGLVAHPTGGSREYCLTRSGEGLIPMLENLRDWSSDWLPEDPALVEREPAILLAWLGQRIDRRRLPDRPTVIELRIPPGRRYWLVLEQGAAPYGCLTDPALDEQRYVYVEAGLPAVLAVSRGRRAWAELLRDGSVTLAGDPELARALPRWFTTPSGSAG